MQGSTGAGASCGIITIHAAWCHVLESGHDAMNMKLALMCLAAAAAAAGSAASAATNSGASAAAAAAAGAAAAATVSTGRSSSTAAAAGASAAAAAAAGASSAGASPVLNSQNFVLLTRHSGILVRRTAEVDAWFSK